MGLMMHWKAKAAIQNLVSLLPQRLSGSAYFWLQRRFGGLRAINPSATFKAAATVWKLASECGTSPLNKCILEIGTGRAPFLPVALWLMGAERTITVDANRYLRGEILSEGLRYVVSHRADFEALLEPFLIEERLEKLAALTEAPASTIVSEMSMLCQIEYLAPADAAATGLADHSVDIHLSLNVLEHIPPESLRCILREGTRLLRDGGLFVHGIDYSDHFSHSDSRISSINFLRYSDSAWERYAGNRYMYMNRLRHDDMLALFEACGLRLVQAARVIDQRALELLVAGKFTCHDRFSSKAAEVVATRSAWLVSRYI